MISDVGDQCLSCIEHGLFADGGVGQCRWFEFADDFDELSWSDDMGHYFGFEQKLEEADDGKFLLQNLYLLPAELQVEVIVLRHVYSEHMLQLRLVVSYH